MLDAMGDMVAQDFLLDPAQGGFRRAICVTTSMQ